MSYYAKYDGSITVKCNNRMKSDEAENRIGDYFEMYDKKENPDDECPTCEFLFYGAEKIDTEGMNSMLDSLSDIIIDGEILFLDEYDEHWRILYDAQTGKWREERGFIVYESGFTESLSVEMMRKISEEYIRL